MKRFAWIPNGRHTFVFKWHTPEDLDELHAALKRLARHPEMDFDWEDASEMREQSKELEAAILEGTHG